MTSRRRSKALISLFAMASVGALVASNAVSATTVPPGTEPAGTEAPARQRPGGQPVAWVRSAAAAAASRTARTRTRATRSARSASPGTTRRCRSTTTRSTATPSANTNPRYLMDARRVQLLRRRPQPDQQRPVRHVHDRVARPADDHVPDQRGRHVVRRRAGRRRRHAAVLGRAEHACSTTRTRSRHLRASTAEGRRGRHRRSSSAPTEPRSRRSTRRRTPPRSTRRPARCSRASRTRSPPASRSTPPTRGYQLVTQLPVISDDGLAVTIDVRHRSTSTTRFGAPVVGQAAHVVAGGPSASRIRPQAKQALIDAFTNDDAAALKPIAEFWNTGFDTDALPDDPGLYLSTGAVQPHRRTPSGPS